MGTDTPSCRFLQICLSLLGLPCLAVAVPWILCVYKSLYPPPSLSLGFQLYSPPPRVVCVVPSIPTRGAVHQLFLEATQQNHSTAQAPLRPGHQTPPSGQSVALLCPGGFSQAVFSLSWSKATSPPKAFPCCPARFRSCTLLLDCLSPHPPLHLPARNWLRSSNPGCPSPPGSKRHKARTELGSPQGCLREARMGFKYLVPALLSNTQRPHLCLFFFLCPYLIGR